MALLATIALVALVVVLRLLFPPVPMFASYFRHWGKKTSIILCSVAAIGAAIVIFAAKR
jgi:hypothetical protein